MCELDETTENLRHTFVVQQFWFHILWLVCFLRSHDGGCVWGVRAVLVEPKNTAENIEKIFIFTSNKMEVKGKAQMVFSPN